ncbi:MAG: cobyrinate a,c-diamide synthase [Desulfobacca sp.]|uniref:cobyrinate a,c-diamide synthase n=1 Tax=Desulfobacca sp. TaxID=2067990 RepID=UPI0040495AAD
MGTFCPRLVLTALRGGSGKTTMTLGLLAAWRQRGRDITPFKKGPDYIDPAWHALAAGRPCYNLDPFLMAQDQMRLTVAQHTAAADGALIEGNRGLYDGLDVAGTFSTAELAKLLHAPVVLVVDCTMTTRTAAALVLGCQKFDPDVDLRGVILNQIARPRHEGLLRATIEQYCGIPVLGAVPRLKCAVFPERHMGLVPPPEHAAARQAIATAQNLVEKYLDLDRLWQIAQTAPLLPVPERQSPTATASPGQPVVIGIIRDAAFQFYYPENFEALTAAGARLVEINALADRALPEDIDALYIGGGFPETNAEALAKNEAFRQSLNKAVEAGLPVYAECGGLMYLGRHLILREQSFPMVGALPFSVLLEKKPQGHGYTVITVDQANPYFAVGSTIRGHEFHYSRIIPEDQANLNLVFRLERGHGITGQRDGICYKNVLATYSHLHALGTPSWAPALVQQARQHRDRRLLSLCHSDRPYPFAAAARGKTLS